MAMRIRTIKPEFWRNRKLASLGREVHDFAARLITASDDEGFCEADPALLAGDLYPFDADAQRFIKKSLPELQRIGFILVRGGEHGILCLPKFREHQRINRPSASRLKPRFEQLVAIAQFTEASVSTHGALSEPSRTEVEGEREMEGEQGKGTGSAPAALGPTPKDLAHLWNITTTPPLPKVADIDDLGVARDKALTAALGRRSLPVWRQVFEIIERTPFLRGADGGWKATIDWATRPDGKKPESARMVLEGNYADAPTALRPRDEPVVYREGRVHL